MSEIIKVLLSQILGVILVFIFILIKQLPDEQLLAILFKQIMSYDDVRIRYNDELCQIYNDTTIQEISKTQEISSLWEVGKVIPIPKPDNQQTKENHSD